MTTRTRPASLLVLAALVVAAPLRAQPAPDAKSQCAASYQAAQERRLDGHLLAAKAELIACMAEDCPAVARTQCGEWLAEVERDLPTVVLAFVDTAGISRADVRVRLDGAPFAETLAGQALPLDPGPHVFVFEPAGGPPVEERATILAGEKNRKVMVAMPRPAPPPPPVPLPVPSPEPPPDEQPSVHPATWVLGAVSLTGFGFFAGFGIHSLALEDCAPVCTDDEVDSIQRERIVADVGLGVGLAGLAATILVAVFTYE
jgi:hypothetical protein